jgi:hypothetical protein
MPKPRPSISRIESIKNNLKAEIAYAHLKRNSALEQRLNAILSQVRSLHTSDIWEEIAPANRDRHNRYFPNVGSDMSRMKNYVKQWTIRVDILKQGENPARTVFQGPDTKRQILYKMRQEMKAVLRGDDSFLWGRKVMAEKVGSLGRRYEGWRR